MGTTIRSICVFCGSSMGHSPRYAEAAATLGRTIAARGLRLIYGGGNIGLMGVLATAAHEAGAEVIGIIPRLLMTTEIAQDGLDELHVVETLHERKALMHRMSDAIIAL
ncbi:MAG: TIGR00730 family Rossman fold protein, partial [Rectinemataceae bacterium]